jgi:Thiamine pyrophosphate enzyme, C-terminal TPP binding domain
VVSLVGDGGMSAQWPALPMAVEQGLPVVFVVMNNRAHGAAVLELGITWADSSGVSHWKHAVPPRTEQVAG